MAIKIDGEAFAQLGRLLAPPPPPPPKRKKRPDDDEPWSPGLGGQQQVAFDSPARYILAYGEKGSGKTIGLLHKLVRHAYENRNALCLIVVRVKAMATKGGAWDKLTNHILPRWTKGLGITATEVKYDTNHNEYLWVENRYGDWSMVVLISALHEHQLRERIRGYEPSFALVDELTSCDGIEYLRAIAAQIGRREDVEGIQQYCAACNPEGPSHWVYKAWFEEPFNAVTGLWDEDFAKFHIPIAENRANLPPGYIESLEKLYRSDLVEAARMLRGEWIDRASGEALFRDIFIAQQHVRPPPPTLERVMPSGDHPFIIGMDPGSANNAYVFMQHLPIDGKMVWVYFDEVVVTRRRIRYDVLFPVVLRKIKFWQDVVGKKIRVAWNSDSSAFNQFRATSGSYDVLELEKIANASTDGVEPLHRRLGIERVRVTQAPKFKTSVSLRVRLMMDALANDQVIVSAGCTKLIACLHQLESEPQKANQPFDPDLAMQPKRSDHLHPFDAATYPLLTMSLQPQLLSPRSAEATTQQMIKIGSGA